MIAVIKRQEKLKCRTLIKNLFEEGRVKKSGSVKVVFLKDSHESEHLKVGFSVSKRNFKSAVDRNRIKRLMRESYRLQKFILGEGNPLVMMFLYQSNRLPQYDYVFDNIKKILKQLA